MRAAPRSGAPNRVSEATCRLQPHSTPPHQCGLFRRDAGRARPRAECVGRELKRQQDEIELIASENIVSRAVLEAAGTALTNKYAEGYPGRRYYGGCQYVDEAETLAIERAKKLFAAASPTCSRIPAARPTRPCSWRCAARRHLPGPVPGRRRASDARLAGQPVGQVVQGRALHVRRQDHRIDMDEVARLARQHKPKMIIAGGTAYPRTIDFARFREIADEVGAYLMVDMAHFAGLVAGGAHRAPSPRPRRHDHHAQDAAGSARRHGPQQ